MSNTVRIILTFICAALAAFLAAGVPDIPLWLNAIFAALVAGFAAVGIWPPTRRPPED